MEDSNAPKVTGIGGIFFKTKDPSKTKQWYQENLGLENEPSGSIFEFRKTQAPYDKAYLQWSPVAEKFQFHEPSQQDFIINYRVQNLDAMLENMRASGIEIVGEVEDESYGKFARIIDLDGHKIELWEPNDTEFESLIEGETTC